MRSIFLFGTLIFLLQSQGVFAQDLDPAVEKHVSSLVSQMTLDEKVTLVGGNQFATYAIPRLGIPALKMTDGPIGVRWDQSTAFPSGISVGATFDLDLVRQEAMALGVEAKALGRDMLLGPNVNMSRVPNGSRGFESWGEDPFLSSTYVSTFVPALQSQKVIATTKHFALNDQEFERMTLNVQADERTMREIYLPPFQAAIEAGSWSVMAAYNKVNGLYASENPALISLLKEEWGFKGILVSDWGATHSTIAAANAGLDLEMPEGDFFNQALTDAVKNGQVSEATLNDKVTRILRAMIATGIFDQNDSDRPPLSAVNSPEHQALAKKIAEDSLVLLKNQDQILPLHPTGLKSIAVIGPNAAIARAAGGGSSEVTPFYMISPLQGLQNALGSINSTVQINYAVGAPTVGNYPALETDYFYLDETGTQHGLKGEYFTNMNLEGDPAFTRTDPNIDFSWGFSPPAPGISNYLYSIRWTGKIKPAASGFYNLHAINDDGVRVYIDDNLVVDNWTEHSPSVSTGRVYLEAGRYSDFKMEYYEKYDSCMVHFGWTPGDLDVQKDALDVARTSDVALLFVGLSDALESEGTDRSSLELPADQISLINAVSAVNPNTVVVINSGEPVLMGSWIDQVKGVVQAWYPGQEGGNAVAELLLGQISPSGKLPVTISKRWEDSSAYHSYPGTAGSLNYSEGIYVGYRFADKNGIEPLFPFGYGLSYTQFSYQDMIVMAQDTSTKNPSIDVWATIQNTGERAGAESMQLYVAANTPEVDRPVQELKGFTKVFLQPGEKARVHFQLDGHAFRYFDTTTRDWRIAPGNYSIRLGASSRDMRLSQNIGLE